MNCYPVGQQWIFDIGVAQIEHNFVSATTMEYNILTGPRAGEHGRMSFEAVRLTTGIWLVSWQEADKSTVIHVEDFNEGTFHSCLTLPNATFIRIKGTMWHKKGEIGSGKAQPI